MIAALMGRNQGRNRTREYSQFMNGRTCSRELTEVIIFVTVLHRNLISRFVFFVLALALILLIFCNVFLIINIFTCAWAPTGKEAISNYSAAIDRNLHISSINQP
jgi:hypothetical protein